MQSFPLHVSNQCCDDTFQAKQKVKGDKVEPQPPQPPASPDPDAPLPNLGYACLNVTLRNDGKKPSVFNNRTCRLATLKEKVHLLSCDTVLSSGLVASERFLRITELKLVLLPLRDWTL